MNKKSERVWSSWDLAVEYGFRDADGRQPHWGKYFEGQFGKIVKKCDDAFYAYWVGGPVDTLWADWP